MRSSVVCTCTDILKIYSMIIIDRFLYEIIPVYMSITSSTCTLCLHIMLTQFYHFIFNGSIIFILLLDNKFRYLDDIIP